jgi:AraC-like DNA-binding protein
MEAWESIQKTLEHIESNLKEYIDMEKLANQANLSPYYFQKLFHRLAGKPVMEYVKLRRLAHAADKLRLEGGKILDLAIEYGFNSHETFTRSFKETYGMTPESY